MALIGFTTAVPGMTPADARLDSFDSGSPYSVFSLTCCPDLEAVAERFTEAIEARWKGLPRELLASGDLRTDVFSVRSAELRVADLVNHTILYRANATADRLKKTNAAAPEWALVRALTDELDIAGYELPSQSGPYGRDFIVRSAFAAAIAFERVGSISEVIVSARRATSQP